MNVCDQAQAGPFAEYRMYGNLTQLVHLLTHWTVGDVLICFLFSQGLYCLQYKSQVLKA